MLKYIITITSIFISITCNAQIHLYTGVGITSHQLTVNEENTLTESLNNKLNYRYSIGTEYNLTEKIYAGLRLNYSKNFTKISVLAYNENNNIRSIFFANTSDLTQHKLSTTIYLGHHLTKKFSIDAGFTIINNLSNRLTGQKINRLTGVFVTQTDLDKLEYGTSTALGLQLTANYHIHINRFSIIPSIGYQYEFKAGIGADTALKIGYKHYVGELKIGYTLQSKDNEK